MPIGNSPATQGGTVLTCPGCGSQMNLMATPMQPEGDMEAEAANTPEQLANEPDGDEMPGQAVAPQTDEFDDRAAEIEKKRGKPFRDKAGVAAALREMRG